MTPMKKMINYVLLFALLFSFIPVSSASAADGVNFYIPDDAKLLSTAALDIVTTPASLTRDSAKISNTKTISIEGTLQQIAGGTFTLTVDQIVQNAQAGNRWEAQSGKTAVTPVAVTSSRFKVTGAELFPGYNRLTITGSNGSITRTGVFYVLYDNAPTLKSLDIYSNNQKFELNETTDVTGSLVLQSNVARIQGNAENAKTVSLDGQQVPVLPNGLFSLQTMTLKPGLNEFEITLANDTDSVKVKRKVYYYLAAAPFTSVKAKQYKDLGGAGTNPSETHSLFGEIPTFTGKDDRVTLDLEFLIPYKTTPFAMDIIKNGTVPVTILPGSVQETVITNTYGASEFKLVKLTTDPILLDVSGAPPQFNLDQQINLAMKYLPGTTDEVILTGNFNFKLASGKKIVKEVLYLPDFVSAMPPDPAPATPLDVTDATVSVPLSGADIKSTDFYILVQASEPLTATDLLRINLQPVPTALTVTAVPVTYATVNGANVKNKGTLYRVTGLPEGSQTLAFSLDEAGPPVVTGAVSFTAPVTYTSKLYVEINNLYNNQIIPINSSSGLPQIVPFTGSFIGFGNRLLGKQLLINNVDRTALLNYSVMNPVDGSYTFDAGAGLAVATTATPGPLNSGENIVKFILTYSDGATPGNVLRKYTKEVKFYIVDENAPNINNIRPLTPPASPRNNLTGDPSTYLPASPELKLINGTYTTSLSTFDLYVDGAGADKIEIKRGGDLLFSTGLTTAAPTYQNIPAVPGKFNQGADLNGNRNSFKLRLNSVPISVATHVFTIELTNTSGGKITQTLTVQAQEYPFNILAPVENTGNKVIVNKNFVLFDVEAENATDVQINGNSATKRKDFPNRYMYTLTGLKPDTENKISIVIKRTSGDIKETKTVQYVSSPGPGAMFMEPMGSKHSMFNKGLQLSFPKGNVLRRSVDGKIQPTTNLLFGIADPKNGNTELMNDYNQAVGKDLDDRTTNASSIVQINGILSTQFSDQLGRDHFTRISDYYWISAGLGEFGKVTDTGYMNMTGGLAPYSTQGTYTTYANYKDRKLVPSERGTLTLSYDDSVVDQAAAEVTVFFLNDKGNWKNIGGSVDAKAHTVTVPFDEFGYYMVGKLKYGYNDVSNHEWARDVLQSLLSKGYMPALYNDQFGAGEYVTRGEFAGLMVRALGMKLNYDSNPTFYDIGEDSSSVTWTYAEIETAARAGIVQGYDNAFFGADLELTRQDAAVMISRAMNVKLAANDDKLKSKIEKAFADGDKINPYARASVDALNSAKVMVGSPVISAIPTKDKPLINFNPLSRMTRAEAGQIAVRLLQKYVKGSLPANLN